ncbi:ABC transporter substrate-binding protein [Microbacterium halophytorum]|uniref:ABC transporter substrate-binding protein n=1 Tax=Microbacterium halophytorum TaxID=2067568 RepID=UPI000CFB9A54|nr:extracellular solute-binding protein [Microbacterium halophytorum]
MRYNKHVRNSAIALTAVGALALTGCGGSGDEGGGGGGDVEIRFSWWGSDDRHQSTQELIDLFESKNEGITVTPDYTDWGGYWDKLATSVAGGNAPDVMTQEERFIADYATRGVVTDMSQLDIATDEIPEAVLATGQIDGAQYGIPTGVNAYTIVADPDLFAEAGVEMPDDTTWTWEDFVDIAGQLSEGLGDGAWGMQDIGFNEAGLNIMARQHGENLYNEDGTVGASVETVTEFFEIGQQLIENGGQPDASRTVEIQNAGPEGSLLGTNTGAMGIWWSNQLGALSASSGHDLELLRMPGETEFDAPGMYFKPAMYYSIAEDTEHPEEAAKFVDFLLNDPEAAEIMLTDRGLPANLDVRDAIQDQLEPADQRMSEFMSDIEDEIGDATPVPPDGSGEVQDITIRLNTEVLFGDKTPEEAAQAFIDEVNAATQG